MKKILIGLTVVTAFAFALAGCGDNPDSDYHPTNAKVWVEYVPASDNYCVVIQPMEEVEPGAVYHLHQFYGKCDLSAADAGILMQQEKQLLSH